jgi:hypothetical protein
MYLSIFYLYKLTHKTNKTFYFGSRVCKDVKYFNIPTFDLGIKYKSSSHTIKSIGFKNFDYEVIESNFNNSDDCYWAEQALIKQHIQDPLCLNKHFMDTEYHSVFSTTGTSLTAAHKDAISKFNKGRPRTNAQIEAIKQRNIQTKLDNITKYNKNPAVCKVCDGALPYQKRKSKTCGKECFVAHQSQMSQLVSTPEHRKKLSDSRKNVKYTDEWRQNLSNAHSGRILSEATKEKMRQPKGPNPGTAFFRKNAPKSPCPHCSKLVDAALMQRWHGDRCKSRIIS